MLLNKKYIKYNIYKYKEYITMPNLILCFTRCTLLGSPCLKKVLPSGKAFLGAKLLSGWFNQCTYCPKGCMWLRGLLSYWSSLRCCGWLSDWSLGFQPLPLKYPTKPDRLQFSYSKNYELYMVWLRGCCG
jgi:hypothetical protein